MRILIAEDDLTTCRILEMVLSKWGYEVQVARDGNDAYRLATAPDAPRLIILDWMMPGQSGVEVCRKLRTGDGARQPYVIILTSRDTKEDTVQGLESGADDYLTKPFHHDELRARIRVGERILELQDTLARRVEELEAAAGHIHTLQGLLPICMHCHKIRDDRDIWQRIEDYVQTHLDARFTHCLCPECFATLYPEYTQPPTASGSLPENSEPS